MFGVSASNTIPGLSDKLEISWATTAAPHKPATANENTDTDDAQMTSGLDDAPDANKAGDNEDLEDGEIDDDEQDQGDMDYDAGDWN